MLKHTILVLLFVIGCLVFLEPARAVHGVMLTETEISALNAADAATKEDGQTTEKRENGFVRALKAPFKAIGRLFGAGKKDDNKLRRLSEKDVKKFESAQVVRVNDATSVPPPQSETKVEPPADTGASQHLQNGRNLLKEDKVNEAIAELTIATNMNSKLYEAYNLLGIAYERRGLTELALKSFELATRGNEPEYLNNLGYLLYKNNDLEGATKYLKRASKLAPTSQRIWNNLGLVQAERLKFDDAYKSFAHAVGEFEGRLNVASRLQTLGYNDEAIKQLEKARTLRPMSTEVLARLVNLYEAKGDNKEAEEARLSLATAQAQTNGTIQK